MIEPNIYCKVSGMALQCVADFYRENGRLPVVLEIGCADGQGTMRFAGFTEQTICVDPMVESRPDIVSNVKEPMWEDPGKIAEFKRRTSDFPVKLVKGCSLWPETLAEVSDILAGRQIDVLIIDGCHHPFEAVWGDFVAYYPLVSKEGFVIFDDLYEECIVQAYKKAIDEYGLEEHERWSVYKDNILQDCASLRRRRDAAR